MSKYDELFKASKKAQLERMAAHSQWSGWDDIRIDYAFGRLSWNRDELLVEILNNNIDTILESKEGLALVRKSAADIANFAGMIILQCDKRNGTEGKDAE